MKRETCRVEPLLEKPVVAFSLQLVLRAGEVAAELLFALRAEIGAEIGDHRQKRHRVVSAALRELLREVVGPICVARLVAVHQDKGEPGIGRGEPVGGEPVEKVVDVNANGLCAHLVGFERACLDLWRRWMSVLASARVAKAVDAVLRLDPRDVAIEAELRLGHKVALRPDELLHAKFGGDPRPA